MSLPDDVEALDSDVRVEDIFWVLERAMSLNVRTDIQNQAWRTLPDFCGLYLTLHLKTRTVLLYVLFFESEAAMTIQTTYTQARANLARLFDEVSDNREVVIITRRGGEDVALVAAAELAGLLETAHLLRSPANAERLLTALARAREQTLPPQTVADLRREAGLDE